MQQRDALTIRVPQDLLHRARSLKSARESMNEMIIDALQREIERREAERTLKAIRHLRQKIRAEGRVSPDSTPLLRALRDGQIPYD